MGRGQGRVNDVQKGQNLTRTVYFEARHKAIAEGGVEGIAAVLQGDDEAEKASLLLCLGFTLIPTTAARWRMRAKFSPFCRSCF